jgi:predicted secreted protein
VDDDDDRDDNRGPGGGDDDSVAVADGIHAFDVAGVARVTVNVASGTLQLIDVEAGAGWTAEIDKAGSDRIKVKFRNGESEAEFEAELEHGELEVEVEVGS